VLRQLLLIPFRHDDFRRELSAIVDWYNEHRPHASLDGCTPNEVYYRRRPVNRRPRFEPRPDWPRGPPCAGPHTLIKGQPGARIELVVEHHAGKMHLPVVKLRRAA